MNRKSDYFLIKGIIVALIVFGIIGFMVTIIIRSNENRNDYANKGLPKSITLPISLSGEVTVYSTAPDFSLSSVRGGEHKLSDYSGSTVLISFIYAHDSTETEKAAAIRAQIISIKSMYKQYAEKGLRVLLIDESTLINKGILKRDTVLNFTYDHLLESIPVLIDDNNESVAENYSVTCVPTTFLISSEGIVAERWDNIALAQQLALAIEKHVGEPYEKNTMNNSTQKDGNMDNDNWSTPAQSKFPGLVPARPLSELIWIVDGGNPWKTGGNHPLKCLVLSKEAIINFKINAVNSQTDESKTIVDAMIKPISKSEADVLLNNMDVDQNMKVFLKDEIIDLPVGKYYLEALVKNNEKSEEILMLGYGKTTVIK